VFHIAERYGVCCRTIPMPGRAFTWMFGALNTVPLILARESATPLCQLDSYCELKGLE
jgi:hypothetical protein